MHYRREFRHTWYGPPIKALVRSTENTLFWFARQPSRILTGFRRVTVRARRALARSLNTAITRATSQNLYTKTRTFYREHLSHRWVGPPLKAAFIVLERLAIRMRTWLRQVAKENYPNARVCNLADVAEYADSRAFDSTVIFPSEAIELAVPRCSPAADAHIFGAAIKQHGLADIRAWSIERATVVGMSDLVVHEDCTLHHQLYDFEHDATSEELHSRALIDPLMRRITWYQNTHPADSIPAGISLLGSCTNNYAHWLTETLPKLATVDTVEDFRKFPVLIDAGLPANIRASINSVAGFDREVIEVNPDHPILVEQLIFVDQSGYVPFGPRDKSGTAVRHGVFASAPFRTMLGRIRENLDDTDESTSKRIFLRRNSSHRMVMNERQVESALVERGYTVVEPEKLDFAQQVRLFSSAQSIVGATGAACANLVFAPPDSNIVILIAKHRQMPYYYWQSMAQAVGNTVSYALGEPEGDEADTIHASYRVCVDDLLELVDVGTKPGLK